VENDGCPDGYIVELLRPELSAMIPIPMAIGIPSNGI